MKARHALLVTILALPLLGMGSLGGGDAGGVPERNFRATFVDRDDTRIELGWLTAGGEMALSGRLGRGDLRVPFDTVASIHFGAASRNELPAKVRLRDGSEVEITVRGSLAFSGRTAVGHYQIRARDLKSVELE